jgi:hypothetical protein
MKSILMGKTFAISRRRFFRMLGVVAAGGLALPWVSRAKSAPSLSAQEAAFYRDSSGDMQSR